LTGLDISFCLGDEKRLADLYGDDLSSHHVLVIRSFLLFSLALFSSSAAALSSSENERAAIGVNPKDSSEEDRCAVVV
jgi:hypothetical protein